jgi:hypothetical protein
VLIDEKKEGEKMSDEAKKIIAAAGLAATTEAMRAALRDEPRIAGLVAGLRRIHYDASIAKGFTPDQALILCQKRTIE